MMKKMHQHTGIILLALMTMLVMDGSAQNADKVIRKGNKLYDKSDYSSAEGKYSEVLEADPTSQKGLFNQGGAYYQQEKYEEALQNFEIAAEMLDDPTERAGAYHNLGNTYFKSQDLEKSIEAYKNALRINPGDEETRYNLALAQSMLKQQEQEQQENQDQNQDQEDQNQEDQENEDQQDQENQDQQDQGEQDGENEQDQQQQQDGEEEQEGDQQNQQDGQGEPGEEEEEQQAAAQPSKLSKEEVQRLLEALATDENKVQGKVIKAKTKSNNTKIEKDW